MPSPRYTEGRIFGRSTGTPGSAQARHENEPAGRPRQKRGRGRGRGRGFRSQVGWLAPPRWHCSRPLTTMSIRLDDVVRVPDRYGRAYRLDLEIWRPSMGVLGGEERRSPAGELGAGDVRQAGGHLRYASSASATSVPTGSFTVVVTPQARVHPTARMVAERDVFVVGPELIQDLLARLARAWGTLRAQMSTTPPCQAMPLKSGSVPQGRAHPDEGGSSYRRRHARASSRPARGRSTRDRERNLASRRWWTSRAGRVSHLGRRSTQPRPHHLIAREFEHRERHALGRPATLAAPAIRSLRRQIRGRGPQIGQMTLGTPDGAVGRVAGSSAPSLGVPWVATHAVRACPLLFPSGSPRPSLPTAT